MNNRKILILSCIFSFLTSLSLSLMSIMPAYTLFSLVFFILLSVFYNRVISNDICIKKEKIILKCTPWSRQEKKKY